MTLLTPNCGFSSANTERRCLAVYLQRHAFAPVEEIEVDRSVAIRWRLRSQAGDGAVRVAWLGRTWLTRNFAPAAGRWLHRRVFRFTALRYISAVSMRVSPYPAFGGGAALLLVAKAGILGHMPSTHAEHRISAPEGSEWSARWTRFCVAEVPRGVLLKCCITNTTYCLLHLT